MITVNQCDKLTGMSHYVENRPSLRSNQFPLGTFEAGCGVFCDVEGPNSILS
jgi:hypothetical protein